MDQGGLVLNCQSPQQLNCQLKKNLTGVGGVGIDVGGAAPGHRRLAIEGSAEGAAERPAEGALEQLLQRLLGLVPRCTWDLGWRSPAGPCPA